MLCLLMSHPRRHPRLQARGSALAAALAATIAMALSSVPAVAQDSLGRYRIECAGRLLQLPSITERRANGASGSVLVSLRELVSTLGGTLQIANASGERLATIANTALRIPADQPVAFVGAERIVLSRAARRLSGDLYVPLDFVTKAVEPLFKAPKPQTLPAVARTPAPAGGARAAGAGVAPSAVTATGLSAAHPVTATTPSPGTAGAPAAGPGSTPESPSPPTAPPPVPAPPAAKPTTSASFTVVLDPGHGGSETGAEGKKGAGDKPGIYEKDVTLDIARSLQRELQAQGDINVLLTRDDDAVVALDERTALANENHADLFLSIHVNSAPRREARGAETYFLSYASKDEDVRTLAAMENNAAGVDKEKLGDAPQGLELVLWDLAQSQYLQQSADLAGSIQKELNEALGARNRGVRQAPFRVLMGATMPAVLVEVGFISNPAEEASLATAAYRDKIAQALARAVSAFLADAKRRMGAAAAARTR